MRTTHVRKVSGSLMRAVPPALLDVLPLTAGARVGLAEDNGRLVGCPGRPQAGKRAGGRGG